MSFIACPEFWCTIDEFGVSWGVKVDLVEESYMPGIELGGVDMGHEVLSIFTSPFETKSPEKGVRAP